MRFSHQQGGGGLHQGRGGGHHKRPEEHQEQEGQVGLDVYSKSCKAWEVVHPGREQPHKVDGVEVDAAAGRTGGGAVRWAVMVDGACFVGLMGQAVEGKPAQARQLSPLGRAYALADERLHVCVGGKKNGPCNPLAVKSAGV